MPFRSASGQFTTNEEPSLDELLAEPIVRMMMTRDGVEEAELRLIIARLPTHRREYGRLPSGSQGPHSPTD
jgi:hypothetical protein